MAMAGKFSQATLIGMEEESVGATAVAMNFLIVSSSSPSSRLVILQKSGTRNYENTSDNPIKRDSRCSNKSPSQTAD